MPQKPVFCAMHHFNGLVFVFSLDGWLQFSHSTLRKWIADEIKKGRKSVVQFCKQLIFAESDDMDAFDM